jgi:hypothetical protein
MGRPGHPPHEGTPPALTAEAVELAVREQAGIELAVSGRFAGDRLSPPFEILTPVGQRDGTFPAFQVSVCTPSDPVVGRTQKRNPDGTQTETDGDGITWGRDFNELDGEDSWVGMKWYGNVRLALRVKTRSAPSFWHRVDQALVGISQPPLM